VGVFFFGVVFFFGSLGFGFLFGEVFGRGGGEGVGVFGWGLSVGWVLAFFVVGVGLCLGEGGEGVGGTKEKSKEQKLRQPENRH